MRWLIVSGVVAGMMVGGMTCGPSTAMARPARVALFEPGQVPPRPVQVVTELTLEVGSEVGRAGALEELKKRARALGADAITEVRLVEETRPVPLADALSVPVVLFGSVLSFLTLNPEPLKQVAPAPTPTRTIRVLRGVAVRYVKKP